MALSDHAPPHLPAFGGCLPAVGVQGHPQGKRQHPSECASVPIQGQQCPPWAVVISEGSSLNPNQLDSPAKFPPPLWGKGISPPAHPSTCAFKRRNPPSASFLAVFHASLSPWIGSDNYHFSGSWVVLRVCVVCARVRVYLCT